MAERKAPRAQPAGAPSPADLVFGNPDLVACILAAVWKDLPSCKGASTIADHEGARFQRLFCFLAAASQLTKACADPARAAIAEFAAALTDALTAYREAARRYYEKNVTRVYAPNTDRLTARDDCRPPYITVADQMYSWTRHSYRRVEGDAAWKAFYGECFPPYRFSVGSKTALRQQLALRIPQTPRELHTVLFRESLVKRPPRVLEMMTPDSHASTAFGAWYEHPYTTSKRYTHTVASETRYLPFGEWLPYTDEQFFVELLFVRKKMPRNRRLSGYWFHRDTGLPVAVPEEVEYVWTHLVALQHQCRRMTEAERYAQDVLTGLSLLRIDCSPQIAKMFERRDEHITRLLGQEKARVEAGVGESSNATFVCRMPVEPFAVPLRDPVTDGVLGDASLGDVLGFASAAKMRAFAALTKKLRRGDGVVDSAFNAQRVLAARLVLREQV